MEVELGLEAERGAEADEFARLYHDRFLPLVRLAGLLTGSGAAAEDIVQEKFAKLHIRFGRVLNPEAWLHTAVVNACRNERRRLGVARRYAPLLAERGSAVDPVDSELIASLRRLPHRQRAVVVLRFYLAMPEAEIAEVLGVRPGTVKSSLHRALQRLRLEVEP